VRLKKCNEPEDRHAPPNAASALPNVYNRVSTRSSSLSSATIPRRPGLCKPVACAKCELSACKEGSRSWHRAPRKAETYPSMLPTLSMATNILLLPSSHPIEARAQRAMHALQCPRKDGTCAVRRGRHARRHAPRHGWLRCGKGRISTPART
jgi:hypothetical protein